MSQRNVEVVRSMYDAFDSHDLDGVLQYVDDDIEVMPTEGLPWSGTYFGRSGVREFIRNVEDHIRLSIETDELIDSGNMVAQIGRMVGQAHATSMPFDLREIHVWGLRDGKVVSFQAYVDTQAQRRVLGLPGEEPTPDDTGRGQREAFWG